MTRLIVLLALTALAACAPQPERRTSDTPLTAVAEVNLQRYLGRWYEIARYDNRFERGCDGVTAEYAMRGDGLISVVNTCYRDGLDGPADEARGRARVVDGSGGAKLEVSFFGPFWGDYWVIELDEAEYGWSVVSEPRGRYLWILSRTPHMDPDVLDARLSRLEAMGFDTGALVYPEHQADAPTP
ncbi:MAG: lipocalin family protein [Oceanicaulis sp.]|nr:lipocalin family protein [Oceanicaulis sp.]